MLAAAESEKNIVLSKRLSALAFCHVLKPTVDIPTKDMTAAQKLHQLRFLNAMIPIAREISISAESKTFLHDVFPMQLDLKTVLVMLTVQSAEKRFDDYLDIELDPSKLIANTPFIGKTGSNQPRWVAIMGRLDPSQPHDALVDKWKFWYNLLKTNQYQSSNCDLLL